MMASWRRVLLAGVIGLLLLISLPAVCLSQGIAVDQRPVAIGPGVTHTRIYQPEGPWAIHVVEADLSEEHLELRTLLGGGMPDDGRPMMGRQGVVAMVAEGEGEGRRPVAAVNGDFFALGDEDYAAIPLGLQVEGGELITFPDPRRSVLYLLADGRAGIGRVQVIPWLRGPGELLYRMAGMNRPPGYSDVVLLTPRFGEETRAEEGTTQLVLVGLSGPVRPNAEVRARIASIVVTERQRIPPGGAVLAARGVAAYALRGLKVGDEVRLCLKMEPEAGEIREALGGGPRLVREGLVSVEHLQERFSERFSSRRHPRTGVGIREGTLVMVTVDGRQPGYSEGMTLPEFAEMFVRLGCRDAMNLDGGGSTTMVVRDRIVNSPSSGVPRAVVNALAVFSLAPVGAPTALSVRPTEVSVLSGEQVALVARGLDEYCNPVPVPREEVSWQCAPALGSVDEEGTFTAAEVSAPTMGLITARCEEMTTAIIVRVTPGPAWVVVTPGEVTLAPGETQQFYAQAYDEENYAVSLPKGRVVWSCEPEEAGGWIDERGLLRAPQQDCQLTVTARVGEVEGEAAVRVGLAAGVLQDFEREREWGYRGAPPGVPGSVEWEEDPLRAGNHCLCLRYDLSQQTGTRTAHVELNMGLPETGALVVRVLGDGQGGWLRARLRDGLGRGFTVDLAQRVDWSGEWRLLMARFPEEAIAPVTLESVYVAEFRENRKPVGRIFLDDVGAAGAGAGP